MTLTWLDARALATRVHDGQVDRAGLPYIDHPNRVAERLIRYGEAARMAGWLHDVVEDSGLTLEDLTTMGYPSEVVAAVDSVTRREGETYPELIERAAADPVGRLVKLADNADNADEARLAMLPPADADRLRTRYAEARVRLLRESDDRGNPPMP